MTEADEFYLRVFQGVAVAIVLAIILTATVFMTGSTFGQRCERLYPHNARAVEDCVDRLSKGAAHG